MADSQCWGMRQGNGGQTGRPNAITGNLISNPNRSLCSDAFPSLFYGQEETPSSSTLPVVMAASAVTVVRPRSRQLPVAVLRPYLPAAAVICCVWAP
ncbi:hypothetical protein EYF80_063367 [Liparis tanakae]|uniref:Uncharacterized protein n=1 Tax=Liparis tanakae TaxID=230148 RepID=A0A4Z2ECB7_9TELE|nr:hypothetical protein EYF80_063367 [Liparis tanakae]